MKICLLGLENLPVLAPEYREHGIGGAQVQQTLLARALARAGHEVSMVVGDYGQADGAVWDGVKTFKAYAAEAGVPLLRFVHPRCTGIWSALERADADIYYTSCAGMQVGLLALFCSKFDKRFVFRVASDTDCDPDRLLVAYARDRWLYRLGLERADAILSQSHDQALHLRKHYGLASRVVPSLVDFGHGACTDRDIDLLWVGNIRHVKRPERVLELAASLPGVKVHMVGGALTGEEALFQKIAGRAAALDNVVFHGRRSYHDTSALYARCKLLLNTSDAEGFPSSYLQAWTRGVPVVGFFDPDGIIERQGLGARVNCVAEMRIIVQWLLADPVAREASARRCTAFVNQQHNEQKSLSGYLDTFEALANARRTSWPLAAAKVNHA